MNNATIDTRAFIKELRNMYPHTTADNIAEHAKALLGDYYPQFFSNAVEDMEVDVYRGLLEIMDVDGVNSEIIEKYLVNKIRAFGNPFHSVSHNVDEVVSDILHDCIGYIGVNLNDREFEDFHGWFDENYTLWDMLPIVEGYADNKPFTNFSYVIDCYCASTIGKSSSLFYKNDEPTPSKEKFASTELLSMSIKQTGVNFMYTIMNTAEYDCMGIIVVEGSSPRILEDYGFYEDEINVIAKMKVGESFGDTAYGNGVVVVRMA